MKLETSGAEIFVQERGDRDGLPVIFLHGFPLDHRMWNRQLAALEREGGFRLIAYDARGLGMSSSGKGPFFLEDWVDDLFSVMDQLETGPAVVCGLSMGGYVALRAALSARDRFRGIVLCDTRPEADSDEGRLKRARSLRVIRERGLNAFVGTFLETVFSPRTFKDNPELIDEAREIMLSNTPVGVCEAQTAIATRTDTSDALPEISCPALLLFGEEDTLTPPEVGNSMANRIVGAEFHSIPNSSHMAPMESPEVFNGKLIGFLKKLKK